jgi:hypothetical protein
MSHMGYNMLGSTMDDSGLSHLGFVRRIPSIWSIKILHLYGMIDALGIPEGSLVGCAK